jgi:hypothetical protein
MEKQKSFREANHQSMPNGAFLKEEITMRIPDAKEVEQILDRWGKLIPKAKSFVKANWKPLAFATTSVAVVGVGAYVLLNRARRLTSRKSSTDQRRNNSEIQM